MSPSPLPDHATLAPSHATAAPALPAPVVIAATCLDKLVQALKQRGYEVLGPVARDGNIVIDTIEQAADLPRGYEDVQAPGRYRLERKDHGAYFGFSVGSQSWKQVFHVPVERLFQVRRSKQGMDVLADEVPKRRVALFGARSCDIAAIGVQDRVLRDSDYRDPRYTTRRDDNFVIAVNCIRAGGTCFCVSMKTGPRAERGFDLALTEILDDGEHRFFVEIGSPAGAELIAALEARPATAGDNDQALGISAKTAASMGRHLDTNGLPDRLKANLEHPRWDEVATRCLACANCTNVCPTCFCTDVSDTTSVDGETAERTKHWDSCFNLSFSHVHGGPVRSTVKARYRQWLTHKLSSWHDQFDSSGCVGCGRCISWCPVGIDITEEATAVTTFAAAAPNEEND
jgi:sulfhydrogenase subunit beta (sulfur reductase)